MSQFNVYRNPDPASHETIPYLLDIQADLLDGLSTRVVVPLYAGNRTTTPIKTLNPTFKIEGTAVVMSTQELAGISQTELGELVVNLVEERQAIISAIDLLITGI